MKTIRRRASLFALSLAAFGLGQASGQTLEEALAEAYRSNPTLEAERARQRSTDELSAQARSNWRPTITANGQFQRTFSDTQGANFQQNPITGGLDVVTTTIQSDTSALSGSIRGEQSLFRGFRNFNEIFQADATVRAGIAQLRNVEQQVLLNAITAYFDVILQRNTVELRQNNVEVLQRQLEAAQDRFRVGEITRTDVAQAEARLALAVSQLVQSRADRDNAEATFERVIGLKPGPLSDVFDRPSFPKEVNEAVQLALKQNPNVETAKETEVASRKGVAVAKGALLPSATAFAQLDGSNTSFILDEQFASAGETRPDTNRDSYSYGVQLSVPIYQSGRVYSQIRQARETNNADRIRIAETERQIIDDAITAYQNYIAAQETIVSAKEQVRANEIAFEGVEQEALVGSRTTLDVLDAEQELLNSRVQLVTAERNEQVAAFALLASIGRLNAQELGLPVKVYDAEDNADRVRWKFIGWNTPVAESDGVGSVKVEEDRLLDVFQRRDRQKPNER